MVYELTKKHLTEDDLKVIKHLRSIDNLFKKGDLTITELFASPSGIHVLKNVKGKDYSLFSTTYISCDGGDPDNGGILGIYTADELDELYENEKGE